MNNILENVLETLADERAHQLRRWGIRQADGSFIEPLHSVGLFLIYMQDYCEEATHRLTRCARGGNCYDTLVSIRKLVALGLACLEQNDYYDGLPTANLHPYAPITLENLFDTIRYTGRMVPVCNVDVSTYLLKIRQCLVDAEVKLGAMNSGAVLVIFREIVQIGVELLCREGAPPREYRRTVTNMRDGKPA
jgi:hypothetical protein